MRRRNNQADERRKPRRLIDRRLGREEREQNLADTLEVAGLGLGKRLRGRAFRLRRRLW